MPSDQRKVELIVAPPQMAILRLSPPVCLKSALTHTEAWGRELRAQIQSEESLGQRDLLRHERLRYRQQDCAYLLAVLSLRSGEMAMM